MYEVGIIGLGAIAAMYGKPEEPAPYCHVGGVRYSKRVKLCAVADLAEPVRNNFRDRWGATFPGLNVHTSAASMLESQRFDIIGVCVRGPYHARVMQEVIDSPNAPRAIFLEKPPFCSLEEGDKIVAAAAAKKIPITVSYSRHWSPHVLRLAQLVKEGMIGKVESVIGYTGGAFLSFASHTTDLICQFGGYDPVAVYALGKVGQDAKLPPGYEVEPSLQSMTIEFASGVVGHQVNTGEHGGFSCEVFGSEGYVRAGIYIPPFAKDKKGNAIDLSKHDMPADASVFKVAYEQIADHLDGGPLPECTDKNWHVVNEVGYAGIESSLTRQRIVLPNVNRTRKVHANG
jgi:predicted dehydrogenase